MVGSGGRTYELLLVSCWVVGDWAMGRVRRVMVVGVAVEEVVTVAVVVAVAALALSI